MNRYFARLAQRTEVVPRPAPRGDAAAPAIVEQHREVVIASQTGTPSAAMSVNDAAASKATTPTAPPTPLTAPFEPHAAAFASQSVSASVRAGDTRDPLAAPMPPSAPTQSPPLSQPMSNSVETPVAVPPIAPINEAMSVPAAPNRHVTPATSARAVPAPEPVARLTAAPLPAMTQGDGDAAVVSATAPMTAGHTVGNTVAAPAQAREYMPARTFTASQVAVPDRAPASASSPPRRRERAAEVHVHIGKIELDVRAAPPPTPAPLPVAAPSVAPAPTRPARFNAHRHYLRGG